MQETKSWAWEEQLGLSIMRKASDEIIMKSMRTIKIWIWQQKESKTKINVFVLNQGLATFI